MMTRDFWNGRSVYVTGGTGLLGGWMIKELIERGAQVVALVRDGAPRSMFFRDALDQHVSTINGDLRDHALQRRVLSEYDVSTIFHLAAQTLVGVAKEDPVGTLDTNVRGTWHLLEAARHAGIRQVVVASSDKAYGSSVHLPYVETHPLRGIYPYDVSKSCVDLICAMYANTYGLPVCTTRCGNLFGGGDLNFSRTVPGTIRATLEGQRFVIRSDGHFVRDFLYVKDAVLANLRLAEHLAANDSIAGEGFNFGMELRLTVLELVHKILGVMGRSDLRPVILNIASGEIREQYLATVKARRVLGWSPAYQLDEALQDTIAWYSDLWATDSVAAQPSIGCVSV